MNNYTWNKAISLPSNTFSSLQNVHLRKPHENNRTFGEVVSVSIDYLSLCIGIKYIYESLQVTIINSVSSRSEWGVVVLYFL